MLPRVETKSHFDGLREDKRKNCDLEWIKTINLTKNLKKQPRTDKNFEKWVLKVSDPPSPRHPIQ